MKFNEEMIQEIIKGDTKTIYDNFRQLEGEYDEYEEDLRKIKYGLDLLFDIRYYLMDLFIIREKSNSIILSKRIILKLPEFWDEIEKREKIMREKLYENYSDQEKLGPRE